MRYGVDKMLKNIYNICIGLFVLCFIISIHELGHYFIGRLLNIKIREFSVGILGVRFLPKFVDSRKTIWRIGLFPIGGYVAFVEKLVFSFVDFSKIWILNLSP